MKGSTRHNYCLLASGELLKMCIEILLFLFILEITGSLSESNSRCFELLKTSHCYRLQKQRPNYYTPQTLPFGLYFDEYLVIQSLSTSQIPTECLQCIVGIFCTLLYPPCDNTTNQPILQCPSSCEKYRTTLNDSQCALFWEYLLRYTSLESKVVSLLQFANCSDPSTYFFGNKSNGFSNATCYSSFNDEPQTTASDNKVLPIVLVIAALVAVAVCAILVVVSWMKIKRNIGMNNKITSGYESASQLEHVVLDLQHVPLKAQYEQIYKDALIKYEDLLLNQEVFGEGSFGKVYRGTLQNAGNDTTEVAVKAVKSIQSDAEMKSFFTECSVMLTLNHPNVLGLLGMCFDSPDGTPLMVLPFMVNGNLRDYLKKLRGPELLPSTFPENLSFQMLKRMCVDVARGMSYLADRRIVHRDLAARNCLLDGDLAVRIGDFGLARDIYLTDYYRAQVGAKLPVKWMSPEMLQDGVSSDKTDVWAFGVTCWEVFSFGASPYSGVDNHLMLQHLVDGLRLQKPLLCPEEIYTLMMRCWSFSAEERPTFNELFISLTAY